MPTKKTVKKTVTKKTATAKRPTAKRTTKKIADEVNETMFVMEEPKCACGSECKCAHTGSRFGRFMIKLIVILIVFALGFGAAKLLDCGDFRGPRVNFDNGCLDVASVQCPKIQALLPMMDKDHNGCITRDEYRAAKSVMKRQMRTDRRMQNRQR